MTKAKKKKVAKRITGARWMAGRMHKEIASSHQKHPGPRPPRGKGKKG